MTYKFGAIGAEVGGAKAGVVGDPADRETRAGLIAAYCAEIRPMTDGGRFLTGPDMGTFEEDFALLRERRAVPSAISAVVGDVPFEDLLTGFGVAVAADTALRARPGGNGLAGRSVAIEGFGKVGGGVVREVVSRGGLVVGVSTVAGSLLDPRGLDVQRLLELRQAYGDQCVLHYGLPAGQPADLFTEAANADVIVPGARPGVISGGVAAALPASVQVIAPAANAAYTKAGADTLRLRGIAALPDFICNAGGILGYRSAADASPEQVLADVQDRVSGLIGQALEHPDGPMAGGCAMAAEFLKGWWGDPPGPPFANEVAGTG
jgi:glutamate dehydrogenase (NAD(P)+)